MYTLDGLPLDDPQGRWYLNSDTGLRIVPPRMRVGASLPGRDGALPSLGSSFEPGSLPISLTVRCPTHGEMMGALETLHGVLGQRRRTMPLVHDYGNGQSRVAQVEILSTMEHDLRLVNHSRLNVVCEVPGVFWRDPAALDSTAPLTTSTAMQTLAGHAGTTASIGDALIRFAGGFSTAYVEDVVTGDRVTINASVAAGEFVVVNTAAWTARKHTSDSWSTTAGANIITAVASNKGAGPMLGFDPDFATGAGRLRVRAVATNPTAAAQVAIRARRSFL